MQIFELPDAAGGPRRFQATRVVLQTISPFSIRHLPTGQLAA